MKQIARNTFIGTLALLLGACNQAEHLEGGEEVPIAFHTRVVSEGSQASGESARLLFWSDADFHEKWIIGNGVGLKPRYTVLLDKEINHYTHESKIYYQTPYTYPYNFEKIHATGYAPDYALTPADTQGGLRSQSIVRCVSRGMNLFKVVWICIGGLIINLAFVRVVINLLVQQYCVAGLQAYTISDNPFFMKIRVAPEEQACRFSGGL